MPRPEVSGEVIAAVESLTEGDFNVPAHKVSFEDRVRVLVQKYSDLQERAEAMEQGYR